MPAPLLSYGRGLGKWKQFVDRFGMQGEEKQPPLIVFTLLQFKEAQMSVQVCLVKNGAFGSFWDPVLIFAADS